MSGYLATRDLRGGLSRASLVAGRNFRALGYRQWIGFVAGFLEPVLYLFSVHAGIARLVGRAMTSDGVPMSYAAFVAPGMLGASVMSGVLVESNFHFYRKMRLGKLYEAVLATPVTPLELALGELYWAVIRGSIYSAVFLAIMIGMGYTSAVLALAALPAAILVGVCFGAIGLLLSTLVRSWRDFEIIATAQVAQFLFSSTFVPITTYPVYLRWVVELSPLHHGVSLLRAITTASGGADQVVHVVYLLGVAVVALILTSRRLTRVLRG